MVLIRPMTEHPLPLSGLRVVDCTVERGELAGRYLGDLGADVVKVEPPGGSPARHARPGAARACRSPGRCATRGSSGSCSTSPPTPTSRGSTRCSTTPTCSSRPTVELAPGLDARELARRAPASRRRRHHRRSASTAPSPTTSPPTRPSSATGGIAFKAGVPDGHAALPPGHLVDDLVSITSRVRGAVRAVPARADRCRTVRRAVGQRGGRALPTGRCPTRGAHRGGRTARRGAQRHRPGLPDVQVQGRLRAPRRAERRQWHALREWLGEPEYLQDPELESFVARREIAEHVHQPAARRSTSPSSAWTRRRRGAAARDRVHARAAARRVLDQRALRVARHVRDLDVGPGVTAPVFPGSSSSTASAPGRTAPPPAVGEHTERGLRQPRRRADVQPRVDAARRRHRRSRACASWTSASARWAWRSAAASPSTAPR